MTMDAILLGGGVGTRYASTSSASDSVFLPKQFQMLGNAPVFIHSVRAFLAMNCFRQIVITSPREHIGLVEEMIDTYLLPPPATIMRVIAGGESRQSSSFLALEAIESLNPIPDRVVIHDACRPFMSRPFLQRVKNCLEDRSYGAWVPVVPVVETLKRVEQERVVETLDRQVIHRVQTPQIFEFTVIRGLSEKVRHSPELHFTDDASLCEYYGIPVGAFEGDLRNIKLTYEFEHATLEKFIGLQEQEEKCDSASATTSTV